MKQLMMGKYFSKNFKFYRIVLELDSSNIASRVSKRSDRDNVPLSEQTVSQALRSAQETIARSLLK